jgi:hypothetical protein
LANIGAEISQIIFLATGFQATNDQIAAWTTAVDNGASIADVANAFVASTAFADQYNGGVAVDPNSAPTVTLTQEIIDHALFSSSAAQVSNWVNSGETIGQVFEAFALNNNWATYTATYYSGGDTLTLIGVHPPVATVVNVGAEISQIIELATGTVPTGAQLAAWENYHDSGGSIASIAADFVASTAFADAYNNGNPVDPNSPITAALAQGIITHALGSASAAQVDAWTASGQTVSQVFQSFALGDQFTAATTPPPNTQPVEIVATGEQHVGLQNFGTFLPSSVSILFNNAPTEILAHPSASNQVDVSSATMLQYAWDLAVAGASASQSGGAIPAHTGVIDWFEYGGSTYVVEATNPTASPQTQTTLTTSDTYVAITGSVDLSGATLSGHILTL